VDAITPSRATILDTRKTTPGWRLLEKYAVRCGGGHNHRMGLFDGVLIKDNHLSALGHDWHAVALAIAKLRAELGTTVPVTIEVDRLEQLEAALECKPDIVLLDNMTPSTMEEAVRLRDTKARSILLEASGGIKYTTVKDVAATGVDRISVGEITHSARALDISLDYEIP
jgi:nicotinate-nucleotide pyrophosphorylase (carboxylating)